MKETLCAIVLAVGLAGGSQALAQECVKPEEKIAVNRAEEITAQKTCEWGFFKSRGDWAFEDAKLKFSYENNALKISYSKPKDNWLGVFYSFAKCGEIKDECADLSDYAGIRIKIKGNGKLRVQLTEGRGKEFGEIYNSIISPKSEENEYKIPFSDFKYRKDWQHSKIDKSYKDKTLDLKKIQGITMELLCPGREFGCSGRSFEISEIGFYKVDKK